MQHLVMTIIGADRPGLIESIATLITQHGGNWLESRMSRLGGQFAGILRVQVPPENQPDLLGKLKALDAKGLNIVVQPDSQTEAPSPSQQRILELVGQDRPGIISQITRVLAGYGVNVEELESECGSAAMTGETLFKAKAKLSIPAGCDSNEIRRKLEKIAEDLIVDIKLEPVLPTEKAAS